MRKIIRFLKILSFLIITPPQAKKKPILLFVAFNGQYTCNPKYILLKLHEKAPSLKLYLVISESHEAADALPDFVEPVQSGSLKQKLLSLRCNVFVSNWLYTADSHNMPFFNAYRNIIKRKKLIIATWHGTPLKKIGRDELKRHSSNNRLQLTEVENLSDFVIAGCKLTADVLSKYRSRKLFPVSLTGTPRCDILINNDADISRLKEKLALPKNKKILLFAPTFRDDFYESGIHQMEELDIPRVLEALSVRFGGEWAFVYRVHYFVVVQMKKRRMELSGAIDGNKGDDMMEYLACTDALMTDYSSSMFDFMFTSRPTFLFALDREHYEKVERGFYIDYDALPFPFADSCDGLIANIKGFDDAAYTAGVDALLKDIGNVEDGKASERIADCILHYIRTGEKRLETVNGVDVR